MKIYTFILVLMVAVQSGSAQSNVPVSSALVRSLDAECTNVMLALSNRMRSTSVRTIDWTSSVPPTNGTALAQGETLGNRIVRARVNVYVSPQGSGWFIDCEAQTDANASNVIRRTESGIGPLGPVLREQWVMPPRSARVNTNGVP